MNAQIIRPLIVAAVMALASVAPTHAQQQPPPAKKATETPLPAKKAADKKHAADTEMRYQAGSSPLSKEEMHQNINRQVQI